MPLLQLLLTIKFKNMKLISMTDFVLEQLNDENSRAKPMREVFNSLEKYANFLKQPLTLGMLVPYDENDVIISKPSFYKNELTSDEEIKKLKYEEAKEKVIFKGFGLNQKDISKLENIICISKDKIQLTFFKKEKGVFLDCLLNNKTFEINTVEDLTPYNLECAVSF